MSSSFYKDYEPVIGIEVHVQLKTKTKIFCSDSTDFDASDNENTSPISMGMPGMLPVLNKNVVEMAIRTGLALNCKIQDKSVFARKNYFYPDLPKGYQISQYDKPICENGFLEFFVGSEKKKVGIQRAHLEEDAGKSTHFGQYTLLNYNRAGIPLLEIVSAPEIHSSLEAAEYSKAIRQIVKYLEVCDGNLEEGSLRCDCNVSVRKKGATIFGTRVEIKNLNSFRFIEKAIDYEIDRQIDAIERGEKIIQETRLYDPDKNRTFTMRVKEDADDYRYFPDPDLLPLVFEKSLIEKFKQSIPELPTKRIERFQSEHGLSQNDSELLASDKNLADYFESVGQKCNNYKSAANWVMVEMLRELNERKIDILNTPVSVDALAELIQLVDQNKISGKIAKTVFSELWISAKSPSLIIQEKGLIQNSNPAELEKIISTMLKQFPDQVQEYKSGKLKVFGFFVGAVMKASKGQANPDLTNELLKKKLGEL